MSTSDRRVKIAHLTTVDSSLRFLVLPQLEAVCEAGHEAIGISAPGPWVPALEKRGIRHIPLQSSTRAMNLRADAAAAWRLWRVLRDERVSVLHTHNPKPGLYGRIVGRLAGVPVVVNTLHGLYPPPDAPRLRRWLGTALEVLAARCSHAELLQNPEDLAALGRLALYPRKRAVLLGNGVDLERFRPNRFTARERRAIRRELGAAGDQILVGCVARLVREKGYRELISAATRLGPRYVILAIGPEDPDKDDALSQEELRAADAAGVRRLGMRTDVERLYAAMDLFVLPSYREGFPRAAMEAAASGLPVVATDVRGCRQVVEHGVTGLLVPVRDADALLAAITTLGGDDDRRAAMASAARRRAEAHFDERRVVEKVVSTYDAQLRFLPSQPARVRRGVKRAIDLAVAAVALVALSPVLVGLAAVIWARLGRPVLFVQQRPGLRGQVFTLYKFRTMTAAVAPDGSLASDEERLTPLGRWLRSVSLDELPELINVLRGDMSLVGPRPLLVEYLDLYSPEQARRHGMRPGITGLAQVRGRNALSWSDRLDLDVWYIDHWSLGLDLRILAETVRAVLSRAGVSALDHATMPKFGGNSAAHGVRDGG